jgi:hypothetical protein
VCLSLCQRFYFSYYVLSCIIITSYLHFHFVLSTLYLFDIYIYVYISSDTEWELEIIAGTGSQVVVLKGGPYPDDTFNEYVGQTCVNDDDLCYKITVHDSFGDGYVNKRNQTKVCDSLLLKVKS